MTSGLTICQTAVVSLVDEPRRDIHADCLFLAALETRANLAGLQRAFAGNHHVRK